MKFFPFFKKNKKHFGGLTGKQETSLILCIHERSTKDCSYLHQSLFITGTALSAAQDEEKLNVVSAQGLVL